MLYQQMRHLELTYGPDASSYQSVMGVLTTTAPPTEFTTTTTLPPLPPTTPGPTPDPLENAPTIYLCNPKDPLCKPAIVYLPTGLFQYCATHELTPPAGP
ncbi:hypothetical protein F7725_011640 [Dissostichus mawsoni]|uniref:Uncharacterized protein n=1 Tax=Dissostichus mawsoni TaxID=36200 RepID=A0A7J5ZBJ7_DISMA|nr:hypothetical protein F7725_011640 [Dissostichus mawsoni]